MNNVFNKVGQTYYGFFQPPIRVDRRPGRPRNQHNSSLCQACRDGECDQARSKKPTEQSEALLTESPFRGGILEESKKAKAKSSNALGNNNSKSSNPAILSTVNLNSCPKATNPTRIVARNERPDRKEMLIEKKSETPKIPVYPVCNSASNQLVPITVPFSTVNSYLYYHPVANRQQLIPGCHPLNQSAVFPFFTTKSTVVRPLVDALSPSANLATITELMAANKIDEKISTESENQVSINSRKENRNSVKSDEKRKERSDIKVI